MRQKKTTSWRLTGSALCILLVSGCSNSFSPLGLLIAEKVDETLGCRNFEDQLWTSFSAYIEEHGEPPQASAIKSTFDRSMKQSKRLKLLNEKSQARVSQLASDLAGVIALRNDGIVNQKTAAALSKEESREYWLERVAQLEIGDRTTDEKSQDVDRVRAIILEMSEHAKSGGDQLQASCVSPTPPPPEPQPPTTATNLFDQWKNSETAPVYGGMKTLAVAYQSCEAATHEPLGPETSNVEGIEVVGRHSSGTGNVREIRDLKRMIASHPYLSDYKRPLPHCHDVIKAPPIYDYGGKPYTTSSNEKLLDLFRNAGSGSKELGIDCSGFVYSAYAVAGLKLKRESSLKASLVRGVSSSMMAEPEKNGLTCLEHVKFKRDDTLKAGDIISIRGHVIMVEDVGPDPFGINKIDSESACKLSNISVKNFQFTLFQSSPSKGSIGINRMPANHYLTDSGTMGAGLREHAVNACKARFSSGTIASKSSKTSIVRHKGTPECRDTALSLVKEDCLGSCAPRAIE